MLRKLFLRFFGPRLLTNKELWDPVRRAMWRAREREHLAKCAEPICPFCIDRAGIYTVGEVAAMSPSHREWTSGGRHYI